MAKGKKKTTEKEKKPLQLKKKIPYYYLLGAGILIPALYLVSIFYYTGGYFSLLMDDAFSYLQYAKQLANGDFFQFNSGDSLTTGVRSFLYTLLLTPGHFFGLGGEVMVGCTFILGIILFLVSAWLTFNIGQVLFSQPIGLGMSILFILHGPTSWGYLSGGEFGLFATSMLAVIYSFLVESKNNGPYPKTLLLASLMALAHPEGILLAGILGATLFFNASSTKQLIPTSLYCFIPLAAGGLFLLINLGLTGSLFSTAFQAESFLFQPNTPFLEVLEKGIKFYAYFLKEILSGFGGDYAEIMNPHAGQVATYLAPFSFLFFLLGSLPLAVKEITSKKLGVNFLIISWFFVGTFIATIAFPYHHFWNKYVISYYPIFIISMVIGIYHFSQALSTTLSSTFLKEAFYGLSAFFLMFFIFSTFHFAVAYGKSSKDYYHQEITLAKWVKEKIPAGVKIATVGSRCIKYLGTNQVIDLSGGVNKEMTLPYRNGVGAIFEQLEGMSSYPECIILREGRLDLSPTGILAEQLHSVKVVGVRQLEPMVVYRADWSLAHSGDQPQTLLEGYEVVDKVDVADLKSESEHKYHSWEAEPGLPISTYAYKLPDANASEKVILDGGRSLSGGEDMVVQSKPGQELKMVMRTTTDFTLRVVVNDKFSKRWENKREPGNAWMEAVCTLHSQWITSEKTRVRLEVVDMQQEIYASAHYWFFQKKG